MRIVVCAKHVLDTSIPFEIDEESKGLVEDGLVYILNPADRCAVEEAVRLKERQGSGEVIVMTLGPAPAQEVLRECLTLGADRALHLLDRAFDDSDAYSTGFALAHAIEPLECDLIFCGSQSLDEGCSQVGAVIAESLDLPQVSAVTQLELGATQGSVSLQRKLDRGGREVIECSLPAVLTIEAGINEPRYPSLPMFMEALHKEIQVVDLDALGVRSQEVGRRGALTKHIGLGPIRPRTKITYTPESDIDPIEALRLMMSGQTAPSGQQSGDILKGEPDYLAQQIIRFLQQNGMTPEANV
ncbi:MAG: electron transfer flavoprotein subunit beta/FixA family protein [Actinobacteria bacterium]|nr:electron transfer flavoprotein subunit beta/FixA family protein [Actinomycetota bacterium]MCL5736366.1 electron transfer flavoprotein subunit beta/FixA family protein [Actinomycetota bacterium]